MNLVVDQIAILQQQVDTAPILSIKKIPQSGSERSYYRIQTSTNNYIATHGENIRENETFLYFARHFINGNLAVPEIYAQNDACSIYIQEDFGDTSLLNVLEQEGFSERAFMLYTKSLSYLAAMQVQGHEHLDYSKALTSASFGKEAILADLLYFKYYFVDALRRPYDKQKLLQDFEVLSTFLSHTPHRYFMFRDFQSRNILVTKNDDCKFIDFQGGMQGAPQYDVASLLWQAKANLPDHWKSALLENYLDAFESEINETINRDNFKTQYNGYVLIRMLQVLGAYGFRGLFERKAHFLTSIPFALQNLKSFLASNNLGITLPEFDAILQRCISDEVIQQFTNIKATADTKLHVTINSFSYLKNGYPADATANGGGFVFDCRGILNPGRKDEYKKQSGEDKAVIDYLESETKMTDFLTSVYNVIDISVEDYITRDFESLMINFGCTGGQHRSVYAANAVARHLKNKYGVKLEVNHLNKENWKQ